MKNVICFFGIIIGGIMGMYDGELFPIPNAFGFILLMVCSLIVIYEQERRILWNLQFILMMYGEIGKMVMK